MARKSTKSGFKHEDILKRFETHKNYWRDIYARGQEDVDFVLGEQWPSKIKSERSNQNRPCLVENRMLPFVHQVINQIRQARPSIIPRPADDKANAEVAEVVQGLIRNIQMVSDADTVYDTAARNSVMAGVGWIRLRTDYAGKNTFDQEVLLERIQNFQSVMLDPNHERQDGSDAVDAFVYTDLDKEAFQEQYPNASTDEGFPAEGQWKDSDTVRVAEYFKKVHEKRMLVEYEVKTISGLMRGTAYEEQVPAGAIVLNQRETQICKIKYAKLTGAEILEEGEFPGEYIPLVPVYGFETYHDNKRTFYSLIHQAKDPQRMLNYWKSASTEIIALQPKAPYVGAKGQFSSYSKQWAAANTANFPFLEYDPVNDAQGNPLPPPMRQAPPTSSGALLQEAMGAADAIKASLGIYDASMGAQTPDISGKAIISRQMQGDNATFHFVDNLAVAIRHVGRIIIGLIPIIYTGNRIVRILGEDGKEALVPLNRPVVKAGKEYKVADQNVGQIIRFDAGKYDVAVEVGASYATKRQELANAIVEIARVNPEIMNVAGDLFVKALDVPGADEIAKRFRAIMPPELIGDDPEAIRLQNLTKALNDLQAKLQLTEEALLAKQKNEEFKNQLEAQKVENDTKKLMIDAAKAEAEIEKIRAEIGGLNGQAIGAIGEVITNLQAQYDDISGALNVLLTAKEEEATGVPETPVLAESPIYDGQSGIASGGDPASV